jgi:hypothetical protein
LPDGAISTESPATSSPFWRVELITEAGDFDARDIAQPHRRAVCVGAQHDCAEFFGGCELALDQHEGGDLLVAIRWLGADRAGCDLRVLGAYGVGDIVRGEVVADELVRIDPNSQRSFRRI